MKATVEREIKLDVAAEFAVPELPGAPLSTRRFTSTYWDTADRGLARAGLTLRHRVEDGGGRWQLKIPHGVARLEIEVDGDGDRVPAELSQLLVAFTRHMPLAVAAVLETHRSGRRVDGAAGQPVAEAVIDAVTVRDGRRVVGSFAELEVELVGEGSERDLRRIETKLRAAGAADGDGRPKLLRVLGVGEDGTSAAAAPPAACPSLARLAAAIEAQHRTLLSRDPGTRLGSDPEDLHDMRVATRRIRSFLRTARPLVDPAWAKPLRAELAWLADRLGEVRDLDVMLEHLVPQVATLDPAERDALGTLLLDRLRAERDQARALLLEALSSPRYFGLLDLLEQPVSFAAGAETSPTLPQIAEAELRKLRKAMRGIDDASPDEQLHAARIRGKRARYAAELAQPLAGRKVAGLLARTKALQDVLGEHQDSAVAEACIRRLGGRSRSSAAAIGAGRLVERERLRRAAARAALPETWAALERAARKAFR